MPTLTVIDILEYAKGHLRPIPADRWKGTGNGTDLTITDHTVGIDLARGPWVKFKFTENGTKRAIQGYRTWKNGDRIKFGNEGDKKECDNDDMDFKGAVNGTEVDVICKFHFEQEGQPFSYRFVGKSS